MRQSELDEPEFLVWSRCGGDAACRALGKRFCESLIGVAGSIIVSQTEAGDVAHDARREFVIRGSVRPSTC